jgi:phage terminase small subunit|tara:strand:+ start:364 stop:972 length:609 start_codon:yes stop_codon:yes gene_type:complete
VPAKVPNDTIRGPNRKLTRRQEKFVKELVANDGLITLREAAIRAGYPPRSAHSRAWELTNNNISPHVVSEIARYREELDEQYGVTYKRHIKDMHRLREICIQQGALSAAVQAEKNRGLAEGLYVSKSEIRTGSIDQMSREDVERELEKIRAGFEQIIDVTPEAVEVEEPDAEVSAKKPRKRPVANNKRRAKGKQKKDSDDAP